MKTILRKLKRKMCWKGYSKDFYEFQKHINMSHNSMAKQNIINLSFDYELGLNGPLWRGEKNKSQKSAELALKNTGPIVKSLISNNISFNIQIVSGLLDQQLCEHRSIPKEIQTLINQKPEYFKLQSIIRKAIDSKKVEIGLHGHTHKLFTHLSEEEAHNELCNGLNLLQSKLGVSPSFFSFPKNKVKHSEFLGQYGIKRWRDGQAETDQISVGLCLSPNTISPKDFSIFLKKLNNSNKKYLLHLWGHFTEYSQSELENYLDVGYKQNFSFKSIREIYE